MLDKGEESCLTPEGRRWGGKAGPLGAPPENSVGAWNRIPSVREAHTLCAGGWGTVVRVLVCRRLRYGCLSINMMEAVIWQFSPKNFLRIG